MNKELLAGPHALAAFAILALVLSSGCGDTKAAARIKTHHNVGGLPDWLPFQLVEPLRYLFKDEVRQVGAALGLPEDVLWRQPFPGPGLAIRIIGSVTEERLEILRDADSILQEEVRRAGLYRELWQSFAVLPAIRSVGVQGDERTYGHQAEGDPIQIVNLRLTARVRRPADRAAIRLQEDRTPRGGDRGAYFGPTHGTIATPVITRAALDATARSGPLLLDEYDATTLVPPGCTARLDAHGNIVITTGGPA